MNILIFGDSITYGVLDTKGGWVARLKEFVDEKILDSIGNGHGEYYRAIYNLGIPGDKIEDLLKRINIEAASRLDEPEYNIETRMVFAIGTNDSQWLFKESKPRVTIEQFEKNLNQLIAEARKYVKEIIFVGLLPVDEAKTDPVPWNQLKSYRNTLVKKYNDVIERVAKKEGIYFIEIFNLFSGKDYKSLMIDGLHPNNEGHKVMFEVVKDDLLKQGWL